MECWSNGMTTYPVSTPILHYSISYLSSEVVVFSGKKFFGIAVDPYLSKLQRNLSGCSTFFVWVI